MSRHQEAALIVKDLSKCFRLPTERSSSLKQSFVNWTKGIKGYKEQVVLSDISFTVEKGDFFGIVGRNGSGKSTLLKLISGIYVPDNGSVAINGSLVSFIELGVGFNAELTGRENIYLNGALMGFDTKEVDDMYDEIVDFAELTDFMDQKLKNYSSGMQVRLAFSCAIRAKSDILILDEILAVGDEAFQRKCNEYFSAIRKDNKQTVVLVTHSMDSVRQYCNKAIMLRDGSLAISGNPEKVADEYSRENLNVGSVATVDESSNENEDSLISAKIVSSTVLTNQDVLSVEVRYRNVDEKPVYPKVAVRYQETVIMVANAKFLYDYKTEDTEEHCVTYALPLQGFNFGDYDIQAVLADYESDVNLADCGYSGELVFSVNNTDTGEKIGGAMKNQGAFKFKM